MKRLTLNNIVSNLVLQIVTIINYLVIPKLILSYFGSEVNGLISSINQLLSYITLVEGGITGVLIANLYQPIINQDMKKVSSIYITAKKFYYKISFIYIIYALCLGIIYPLIFNTSFSFIYILGLTMILSINLLIQYMLSTTDRLLLQADKRIYIISNTQSLIIIFNIILSILSLKVFPNVHLLKLLSGILFACQPIVYKYYVNKYFKIEKNANYDDALLKQRWNGFAINIAAFVHISTDVTLLTIFTDLETVSIYSVYALISNGLKQIITSVTSSFIPVIGQTYAKKDDVELNKKIDLFEYILFLLLFFLYSVAILLITPFVLLYTKNIFDVNYNQPVFGVLLLISELLYLVKSPHLNLAYSANKFKEITIPAFVESILNIIISIILVRKYKLIGIMIGTIVAMAYRMAFQVYFTNKHIIKRKQTIFYKKIIIFSIPCLVLLLLCYFLIPIQHLSIISWILYGIIYSIIILIGLIIISVLFFRNELVYIKKYLFKKEQITNEIKV